MKEVCDFDEIFFCIEIGKKTLPSQGYSVSGVQIGVKRHNKRDISHPKAITAYPQAPCPKTGSVSFVDASALLWYAFYTKLPRSTASGCKYNCCRSPWLISHFFRFMFCCVGFVLYIWWLFMECGMCCYLLDVFSSSFCWEIFYSKNVKDGLRLRCPLRNCVDDCFIHANGPPLTATNTVNLLSAGEGLSTVNLNAAGRVRVSWTNDHRAKPKTTLESTSLALPSLTNSKRGPPAPRNGHTKPVLLFDEAREVLFWMDCPKHRNVPHKAHYSLNRDEPRKLVRSSCRATGNSVKL